MKPRPNWPAIKAAYLADEGSLRALAQRFGVSLNTLEKRCAREGWRQEMAALCGTVAATAAETAVEEGKKLGMTAAAFVERTIAEIGKWLDRIEALADSGQVTPFTLKALVSAWRDAIAAGREAFGLDEQRPAEIQNIGLLIGAMRPSRVEPLLDAKTGGAIEDLPSNPAGLDGQDGST
jgi:hypothetical protein